MQFLFQRGQPLLQTRQVLPLGGDFRVYLFQGFVDAQGGGFMPLQFRHDLRDVLGGRADAGLDGFDLRAQGLALFFPVLQLIRRDGAGQSQDQAERRALARPGLGHGSRRLQDGPPPSLRLNRGCPVISSGWGKPMRWSMVGATSHRAALAPGMTAAGRPT